MTVISIIGTSGVGKSLLVRQLAALDNAPCFLEGEEGVLPATIMQKIVQRNDPVGLFSWFADRYKRNLANAHRLKTKCYVDGAIMSIEAHIIEQDKTHHATLRTLLEATDHLQSDIIVLLTAPESMLRKFIEGRGRQTEQSEHMVQRSLLLQREFLRLAKQNNVIVVSRDELDFHNLDDLQHIKKLIGVQHENRT